MREYSSPAVVEISPAATLADVVFERAEREPQAVALSGMTEVADLPAAVFVVKLLDRTRSS